MSTLKQTVDWQKNYFLLNLYFKCTLFLVEIYEKLRNLKTFSILHKAVYKSEESGLFWASKSQDIISTLSTSTSSKLFWIQFANRSYISHCLQQFTYFTKIVSMFRSWLWNQNVANAVSNGHHHLGRLCVDSGDLDRPGRLLHLSLLLTALKIAAWTLSASGFGKCFA